MDTPLRRKKRSEWEGKDLVKKDRQNSFVNSNRRRIRETKNFSLENLQIPGSTSIKGVCCKGQRPTTGSSSQFVTCLLLAISFDHCRHPLLHYRCLTQQIGEQPRLLGEDQIWQRGLSRRAGCVFFVLCLLSSMSSPLCQFLKFRVNGHGFHHIATIWKLDYWYGVVGKLSGP